MFPARQAQEELKQMDNIRVQRLQKLEGREKDTLRAIKWLEENQGRFRQPILEPVCMSLNVLDSCYIKQAEAFFGGRDFYSFVAQNEDDRETFLRAVGTGKNCQKVPLSFLTPAFRSTASDGGLSITCT